MSDLDNTVSAALASVVADPAVNDALRMVDNQHLTTDELRRMLKTATLTNFMYEQIIIRILPNSSQE